jgi:hypothetical protein
MFGFGRFDYRSRSARRRIGSLLSEDAGRGEKSPRALLRRLPPQPLLHRRQRFASLGAVGAAGLGHVGAPAPDLIWRENCQAIVSKARGIVARWRASAWRQRNCGGAGRSRARSLEERREPNKRPAAGFASSVGWGLALAGGPAPLNLISGRRFGRSIILRAQVARPGMDRTNLSLGVFGPRAGGGHRSHPGRGERPFEGSLAFRSVQARFKTAPSGTRPVSR